MTAQGPPTWQPWGAPLRRGSILTLRSHLRPSFHCLRPALCFVCLCDNGWYPRCRFQLIAMPSALQLPLNSTAGLPALPAPRLRLEPLLVGYNCLEARNPCHVARVRRHPLGLGSLSLSQLRLIVKANDFASWRAWSLAQAKKKVAVVHVARAPRRVSRCHP